MNVAVTGATGFVGRHLVEALLARDDKVSCLVRSLGRAAELAGRGCRLCAGDLDATAALEAFVSGAEIVYHVAGLVQARSEAEFLGVNRDGAVRLAQAAQRAGARRFVYVSSLSATGPTRPGTQADESTPPHPVTAYGRSKLAAEEALRGVDIPVTTVRPPAVYGPHDWAMARLFRMARRGLVTVPGDGRQELSLIHATDLAQALIAAGISAQTSGRIYHAAHPEVTTQRRLAQAIVAAVNPRALVLSLPGPLVRVALGLSGAMAHALGRATQLDADKANEFLAPAFVCSPAALTRDAGWSAQIDLARGVPETAAWYRQAGWL